MNETNVTNQIKEFNTGDKRMSEMVIRLKNIEVYLWKFGPPVLVILGVIRNTLTILVMRR